MSILRLCLAVPLYAISKKKGCLLVSSYGASEMLVSVLKVGTSYLSTRALILLAVHESYFITELRENSLFPMHRFIHEPNPLLIL